MGQQNKNTPFPDCQALIVGKTEDTQTKRMGTAAMAKALKKLSGEDLLNTILSWWVDDKKLVRIQILHG